MKDVAKKDLFFRGWKKERKKDKNDKIKVCLSNATFVDILFQIR